MERFLITPSRAFRRLLQSGCEKLFKEQTPSVGQRPELDKVMDCIREGDVLVVTKLDRLARNVTHLEAIIKRIRDHKAHLQILSLGIDTATATGELVLNVMASIAQFERSMMLERQREGIAKAKADGKYKGRGPTARAKAEIVRQLDAEGSGPAEIARQVKIGRSSVYRILNA